MEQPFSNEATDNTENMLKLQVIVNWPELLKRDN
jgi:hypothetical protein